jgi:uncharacterized membrane protein HdeD (DUF308 family)
MTKKSFIPQDKPKSWVICIISGLIGIVFGLIAFFSGRIGIAVLPVIGILGFFFC